MYRLKATGHFDAAHWLPGHGGKCRDLHGHRWEIAVFVEVDNLNRAGMVVDFALLKKTMNTELDVLDHACLNHKGINNPTAENIATILYDRLIWRVASLISHEQYFKMAIEVQESPGCSVRFDGEADGIKVVYNRGSRSGK